jgi:hypothetical protein
VKSLKTDQEQIAMVRRVVAEKWSGSKVLEVVSDSIAKPKSTLREVKQTSIEERFEKRVLEAAKTLYALASMPIENYEDAVVSLAMRATDANTKQALQHLRDTLEDILLKSEGFSDTQIKEVSLLTVIPPLDGLARHLPVEKFDEIEADSLTGGQILDQLLKWAKEDSILASRLDPFFKQIEADVEALRAGEPLPLPTLVGEKKTDYPDLVVYRVSLGASIYWAHELLVRRGESQFKLMKVEIVRVTMTDD